MLSCGHFEKDTMSSISEDIIREFDCSLIIQECTIDISNFYNPRRRQYDANAILHSISTIQTPDHTRIVALFRIDLFVPILTYIFGQAFLNGTTAIASLYRLRNELYGLERNNTLLINRFRKVVIHELGHTFGLIHCQNPICVMRSSTYVEDIDQKEIHFCYQCQKILNQKK